MIEILSVALLVLGVVSVYFIAIAVWQKRIIKEKSKEIEKREKARVGFLDKTSKEYKRLTDRYEDLNTRFDNRSKEIAKLAVDYDILHERCVKAQGAHDALIADIKQHDVDSDREYANQRDQIIISSEALRDIRSKKFIVIRRHRAVPYVLFEQPWETAAKAMQRAEQISREL